MATTILDANEAREPAAPLPLRGDERVPRTTLGRGVAPALLIVASGVVAVSRDPGVPTRQLPLSQVGTRAGVRPEMAARHAAAGTVVRAPAVPGATVGAGPVGGVGAPLPLAGEAVAAP